jgi:Bacterial extracellular solute-binding protein
MTRSMTRNRFRFTAGVLGIGALVLAAGCSSSSATSASSTSAAKVTLVVYSAQGYDRAMTAAFQKATGIPVKLDDNSTGPLLTQIEASKNNPNWGLLWVDGATAFAGLDQQGLLQKGFEPKVAWNSLGQQSVPSDKSYTPTGVTLMAALVYNKTKVTSPPATWQQLLQPAWKDDVGMNDPSQSGPTYRSSPAIRARRGLPRAGAAHRRVRRDPGGPGQGRRAQAGRAGLPSVRGPGRRRRPGASGPGKRGPGTGTGCQPEPDVIAAGGQALGSDA